ncbi:MAG: DNA helicase II [Gammaproteobacteria bacterium CG11_big_fil_rev_8_21_14_0_20_46_22]|nr:MAG: DNA helicase II [Gammaproteobacteria bacterium CG12_big_fil_rev_8_21_14_0_65_46_12]PIR11511.1 MAG: DNA helicase II [Gammaproteobacteria bacterium CG11_big_fil_rev_8_21_14_0_20_46_22]
MEDISHILNDLNDAQRQAVSAPLSNLLVLAGAGSGKTRVLVHRIAWLIAAEGLSPFNILAVTFTNKAAREMNERIESMLGLSSNAMWVGTFHGLAHRLLRAHYQEAGLSQNFQILDSDDQYRMIRRLMREHDIDENQWPPKQVQWFINQKKDDGLRAGDIKAFDYFEKNMLKMYALYEEACFQQHLVDFAELLLRTFELMRDNLSVLDHYQKRFRYWLVDEFQDTNRLQYAWLKLLCHSGNKIMVVGDDDQSIYSWRGAQVENIRRFEEDFKPVTHIRLEQNYRSTGTILNAANTLIENNNDRMGKTLWTESSEGEPISIYAAFNDLDEARFIVDKIKQWQHSGRLLREAAVLYRSNAQSRILEEAFLQAGVPYRIHGGLRFYERAEIKDALAYLRLLENTNNDSAFERIINVPVRGIGNRSVATIREIARESGLSLWQAALKIMDESLLPSRAVSAISAFIELIQELQVQIADLKLPDKIKQVLHLSTLLDHYRKERGEKARAKVENLEELSSAAAQFIEELREDVDGDPLTQFLAHTALEAGEGQADKFTDCAQLMTMHSAKGLEFPLVFIAGLEEGLFPHQMSLEDQKGCLEERRLCYVGMTRAMEKLILSYAEVRALYGRETYQAPSRFLHEIPRECVEEIRPRAKVTIPQSRGFHKPKPVSKFKDYDAAGFRPGQLVAHAKFGQGIVLAVEGEGDGARVQVNFKKAGSKWLLQSFAKLETIA